MEHSYDIISEDIFIEREYKAKIKAKKKTEGPSKAARKSIRIVDREIAALELEISELRAEKSEILSGTLAECLSDNKIKGCGKRTKIRNLVYYQAHNWHEPEAYSDGFWDESNGSFICPKCKAKNRLYDRNNMNALKSSFKKIVCTY